MDTVFNVLSYGADPTGAVSSHAAFANTIIAAKSSIPGPGYGSLVRGATVYIPKGSYEGIASLDLTNCAGLTIEGEGAWGSTLYANGQTTPYPVIDCTGSSFIELKNFQIFAMNLDGSAPTIMPQCGIIFADSIPNPQYSNKNVAHNVYVDGWYGKSALVCYRTTNNNFFTSVFCNKYASAPALHLANGTYANTYTSAYTTLNSSGFVCNENAFFGCEVHNSRLSNPQCAAVFLDGTYAFNYHAGIIDGGGTGQPMIWLLNSPQMTSFFGTKFYTESTYIPADVFVAGGTTGSIDRFICEGSWKDNVAVADKSGGTWTRYSFNGGLGL